MKKFAFENLRQSCCCCCCFLIMLVLIQPLLQTLSLYEWNRLRAWWLSGPQVLLTGAAEVLTVVETSGKTFVPDISQSVGCSMQYNKLKSGFKAFWFFHWHWPAVPLWKWLQNVMHENVLKVCSSSLQFVWGARTSYLWAYRDLGCDDIGPACGWVSVDTCCCQVCSYVSVIENWKSHIRISQGLFQGQHQGQLQGQLDLVATALPGNPHLHARFTVTYLFFAPDNVSFFLECSEWDDVLVRFPRPSTPIVPDSVFRLSVHSLF